MTTQTEQTKRIADISAVIDATKLTLNFRDGTTIAVDASSLSPDIQHAAMMHGLKQKLVDAAALSRNPETGKSATIDDKYEAVLAVANALVAGEWNRKREPGEGGNNGGLLFRALCVKHPDKSAETIRTWLNGKSKEQQAAMRLIPEIATIIDKLRAEKAKTTINEAELFEGL